MNFGNTVNPGFGGDWTNPTAQWRAAPGSHLYGVQNGFQVGATIAAGQTWGAVSKPQPLYVLRVCQQPERARLCSYKEENETIDRRPVDPPPIVELLTFPSGTGELFESTAFFVRVTIVHSDPGQLSDINTNYQYSPVKTPNGLDATTGEVIQTPEKLKKLDGRLGALCVFAKLSVRVPGIFRLKFTLHESTELGIAEITETVSDPFEVYSPKLFKGMKESTLLTRHLAAQGIKVKLRTDKSVKRRDSRRRPAGISDSSNSTISSTRLDSPSSSPPRVRPSSAQLSPLVHDVPTSRQTLVWRSQYSLPLPDIAEASSGSTSMAKAESPEPRKRTRIYGDDGTFPSFRVASPNLNFFPVPPAYDLSAFSLSNTGRSAGAFPLGPAFADTTPSGNRSLFTRSYPTDGQAPAPFSLQARTSSTRSEIGGLPSLSTHHDFGPGDEGVASLSSSQANVSNFVLPPLRTIPALEKPPPL